MVKNVYITESQLRGIKHLLLENEGTNLKKARNFLRDKGYDEAQRQEILNAVRTDIPNSRLQQCKFMMGVVRMYLDGELKGQREISDLNKTLKYIASDAHANEYDYNLNGESLSTLVDRFSGAARNDLEKSMSASNSRRLTANASYTIVPIDSFEEAEKYGDYTSWCVTHYENMYDSYTQNGTGRFYFCLRNGFENEPRTPGNGCPLDSYGLSMIAVSVDMEGAVNTITCRWNHDEGGNDNIMTVEQLEDVIGRNFYQTFRPYSKEELHAKGVILFDEVQEMLDSGKNPKEIFGYMDSRLFDGFARVCLNDKWNFIGTEGRLLSGQWFDGADVFHDGIAKVFLNDKCNFIDTEGRFLSGQWFDNIMEYPEGGFARVYLNGKWNFIDTEGRLLSNQWFDEEYNFNNGFARVRLKYKWNFIDTEGRLLSDQWFEKVNAFHDGFARVYLNGKWNFIDTEGRLLSNQWFDGADVFHDGFAYVKLNYKCNFIDTEGRLLSDQWFDDIYYDDDKSCFFVELNGKWRRFNANGKINENKKRSQFKNLVPEGNDRIKTIFESAGDLEYHFTTLRGLCGMMETNTFRLTPNGEKNRGGENFMSLSRQKSSMDGYGDHIGSIGMPIVRIELDGRKINSVRHISIKPYDWFYNNIGAEVRSMGRSEYEDSVVLKNGKNEIGNAIKYITRIDITLPETEKLYSGPTWRKFLQTMENHPEWAEKMHFFSNRTDFDYRRNEVPKNEIYYFRNSMKQAMEENKTGKRIYITESQFRSLMKENNLLLEAVNKVDNFDLIGDLIDLTDQDKFYFVQIVKRWKDNKDKSGADTWRQQARVAGTYHSGGDFGNFASGTAFKVRTKAELLAIKPQIVSYCDANNARAYITSNPRSEKQINDYLKKLQRKYGSSMNPWDQKYGFEHMAGQAKKYDKILWPDRVRLMLDIDTEQNTWYIPSSKSQKFHTKTAKNGKTYIDDMAFPKLRNVEVRYAKHGAQTLVAKYPNQEAEIQALGGINVWDYTHEVLQQNGIPVEKEYNTPSNGLHITIKDISNIQNLDQVEDDLRIFDDGVNEGMTQLVHFNFDGKLILYSNVDTIGY